MKEQPEPGGQPSEEEAEAAWRQEVTTRVAALDAGEVETIPWEEIRGKLWARLREVRGSVEEKRGN